MPKIEVENVLTKNAEFMEEAKKNIVRSIVQSVSRGNVNLQLGRYITEIDKEKMRQQVIAYKIKAKIDQD